MHDFPAKVGYYKLLNIKSQIYDPHLLQLPKSSGETATLSSYSLQLLFVIKTYALFKLVNRNEMRGWT